MDKRVIPPVLVEASRHLRQKSTSAEVALWELLRGKQLGGVKFRRQFVIEPHIADFYCHVCHLVIELDGGIHDTPEVQAYDQQRQAYLENKGYVVLRFRNEQVLTEIQGVLEVIWEQVAALTPHSDPTPQPPPLEGEGE